MTLTVQRRFIKLNDLWTHTASHHLQTKHCPTNAFEWVLCHLISDPRIEKTGCWNRYSNSQSKVNQFWIPDMREGFSDRTAPFSQYGYLTNKMKRKINRARDCGQRYSSSPDEMNKRHWSWSKSHLIFVLSEGFKRVFQTDWQKNAFFMVVQTLHYSLGNIFFKEKNWLFS